MANPSSVGPHKGADLGNLKMAAGTLVIGEGPYRRKKRNGTWVQIDAQWQP